MKRFSIPIAGAAILAFSVSLAWAGPAYRISEASSHSPPTYSEQISDLLTSGRSDAGDRTYDSLVATEKTLYEVGRRERALVKLQAVAPSESTRADLENTRNALSTLRALHSDLTSLQRGIHAYRVLTEKAETAAVRGETVSEKHIEKTNKTAARVAQALESVEARGAEIARHVKTLDDPELRNLAGLLEYETPALSNVASMCTEFQGGDTATASVSSAERKAEPVASVGNN